MDIHEEIRQILLKNFIEVESEDELTNDMALLSSKILDSISILQLVDLLEKKFNVSFEAHEIDKDDFDTVNKIAEIIEKKQA